MDTTKLATATTLNNEINKLNIFLTAIKSNQSISINCGGEEFVFSAATSSSALDEVRNNCKDAIIKTITDYNSSVNQMFNKL